MAYFQKKNLTMLLLLVLFLFQVPFHGFSDTDDRVYDENYWWTRIQSSLKDRRGALLEFLRAAVEDRSGAVQYLLQTRGPALFYPIAKERDRDFQRLILVTLKTYDLYHLKAFYGIPEEGGDAWISQIFQKIFFIYSQDRRFCFALRERLEKAKAWEWREDEALMTLSLVMSAMDERVMEAEFVTIPAGTFVMGSPYFESGREGDEILHKVTLEKDFEMQTTEVTQLQWYQVMENNPSRFKEKEYCASDYTEIDGISICPNHPVENVSWNEVQLFISRLNERDARYQYRLPTEAEWEVAARGLKTEEWIKLLEEGGMGGPAYSFGDDSRLLSEFGWFGGNSGGQTHAVAQKTPNAFGLYDMHGNVREWTFDVYMQDSLRRVIRGGSWRVAPEFCRSAYRHRGLPDYHPINGDIGFRLVKGEK